LTNGTDSVLDSFVDFATLYAMDDATQQPRKGRGAIGNLTGRFEREQRTLIDDGWGSADAEPLPLNTTYTRDTARSIIARNDSPDIGFDRSINPYRGCEHGCIYCYARPSHAYLGLSPGLDFESRIFVKDDGPELLRAELAKPGYRCDVIALGANTDPYQPAERKLEITRRVLQVLQQFRHPVGIVTKSALVQRDIDILAEMARENLASVAVSVTTLDRALARKMEPRAATPERRLETIAALAAAGIPTTVMAAPMIPALNDHEMESILERAAECGARRAAYTLLRVPLEIKELVEEWLEAHQPGKAKHVMSLLKDTHGGKPYTSQWGTRMRGLGPYAEMLRMRFEKACKRLGLNERERGWSLDTSKFRRPPQKGDQLSLL
jgi:DNA repair photolyase